MREIPWSAPGSFLELIDSYQIENYLRLTVKSVQHSHSCPTVIINLLGHTAVIPV